MKYTSEQTLRSAFEHLDHADPAHRRVAVTELVKRKQRPEALLVLRVARASEVDAGVAGELAQQLDEALATCGIKVDPESSGRVDVGKVAERLEQGDLPHKLRALELLIWFPQPQAVTILGERLPDEPDPWVRAAIAVVIGEIGGPAASGVLQRLSESASRAARCARFMLAKLKPASRPAAPAPPPPEPQPEPPPEPPPEPGPEPAEDNGAISCPMCQAAVALSRRTMGDLVTCPRCGMGFRLTLERAGSGQPPQVGTQAVSSSEIVPPGSRVRSLYEILGELGRGGQGAVYRVRPKDGKKEFALKYLDSSVQISSNQLLANQDIASLLDHPNIVSVFATGVDEPGRRTFAVYEIVEGRSLSAILKDGRLPVEKALDIVFQVLAGLAHSHAQGVVHRDLKPDNILVTHEGVAKITDFGIGIFVGDREKLNASDQPFVGTPGYAAPEQITGWGALRASDVYAIGMTLYEMLAGRLPFPAPTLEILLHHQVNTAPRPPSAFAQGIPQEIEAVVMKCLEKSPVKRPGWAGDLFEQLRAATRAAGFEAPLATSAGFPEPRRIDSLAGLAAAWSALLVGALLFAGPIAAISVVPLRKLIAPLFEGLLLAWLGTLYAFTRYARAAARGRAPESVAAHLFGNFSGSSRGGFGVIPVIVLSPLLVRMLIDGDRIDALPVYVPTLVVLAVIVLMPTWSGWMETLLADPVEAHLERGFTVLKLDGLRGWSCQVDGGPASRLPCRMLLKEGPHHLVVSGDGHTQRFSLLVGSASVLATKLSLSGTTIVDQEGEHETSPPGVLIDWLGSPVFAGIVAIVCALAALAIGARILGHALGG